MLCSVPGSNQIILIVSFERKIYKNIISGLGSDKIRPNSKMGLDKKIRHV